MRGSSSLFTNAFEIAALSEEDVFDRVQHQRTYPARMLPSFLHESTHHWCFRSPVGNALALVRLMIARERALAAREDADLSRVAKPLYAYTITDVMMRPLIEGMALFAEFDMLPQAESTIASVLAQNVGLFFRSSDAESDPTAILREPLIAMRDTAAAAERKAITYLSSASLDSDGYLLGYIAVKQIWLAATKRYPPFRDTELFLLFFRSFVFADHKLAILLMDPSGEVHDYINRLTHHISGRVQSLFAMDLEKVVPVFVQTVEAMAARGILPGFAELVPWDSESSRSCFQELVDDFLIGKGGGETHETFGVLASQILTARNVMKIGRIPAMVSSQPRPAALPSIMNIHVWLDATSKANKDLVMGQRELYLLPAHQVHILLDRAAGGVTDFRVLGDLPGNLSPDVVREWLGRIEGIYEAVRNVDMLIGDSEQNLAEQLDEVQAVARREAKWMYERYVFMGGEVEASWRNTVGKDGLWAILDEDLEFIFRFARLSNLFGAGFRGPSLEHKCEEIGLPYHDIIIRLLKIEQKTNWPFVYADIGHKSIDGVL